MNKQSKSESTGLTPTEIAALTARVPCSGNPEIDAIITQSLRFSTASEFLAQMGDEFPALSSAETAVMYADALLVFFRRKHL